MAEINISNRAGRDAVVLALSVRSAGQVRRLDAQGRQARSVRLLKAPVERSFESLVERYGGPEKVGPAILEADPEIDMDLAGKFLRETSRVYIDRKCRIVHRVREWEILRNPDGTQRERRPRKVLPPNVGPESPLRWSGVFIKKEDACRKFVLVGKLQLVHVNGLTYDFLYGIAKELEQKDSLMLVGAGPKSNQPLILRRGGTPYRGFLEGRTQDDQYCLLLHFSNLELKAPAEPATPTTEEG